MPAPADKGIIALHQWLNTYGPRDSGDNLPPTIEDRNELLDHWAQHSDQCRHCNAAAAGVKTWRKNVYRVLALSVLLGHFTLSRISIVCCIALLNVLKRVENGLTQGQFEHYNNH
jgi:hypothetical protein